ncbi:MAG: hypothetical protein JST80_07480, partial [Bdellovibrionales bacterium]|nr:hypothetical protein [Bdellovibrionales bacterium]
MSLIFVLGAVTLYHPYAEAQRGGGGSRGGGSSGGSRGGGSSSGGYGNSGSR